jgi:hypothetical protein
MDDRRTVLTGRFAYGQARSAGQPGGQASAGYPLRITGHLVPEEGCLPAYGAVARGGFPATGGETSSAASGWI